MTITKRVSSGAASGQSLVELAISLTLLILLLSGAVTFGMAFFSYVALRDAAQEGALYGSFNPYIDANNDGKFEYGEPVNAGTICTRVMAGSNSPINMVGFSCPNSAPAAGDTNYIYVVATTGNACEGSTTIGGVPTANALQVTVAYNYPVFMPFVGAIIGSQSIPLHAIVTDTILEPRCP